MIQLLANLLAARARGARTTLLPMIVPGILAGCMTAHDSVVSPFETTVQMMEQAHINAGNEIYIRQLHKARTWLPYGAFSEDPIEYGKQVDIPVHAADVKLVGPDRESALRSLALKIWMIENARHTVDAIYYIFSSDLAGKAILGALCNAVKRGVDVRVIVDAIGSFALFPGHLRGLGSCAEEAGFMKTASGQPTPHRARVQVVKFNALSKAPGRANRRSHDKLLVVDGGFPDRALVLTGGRNISLDYYGLTEQGKDNPNTYHDLEILLRAPDSDSYGDPTVGDVSEIYFGLLFLSKGNKFLKPIDFGRQRGNEEFSSDPYRRQRVQAQQSLARLKGFESIHAKLSDMPDYLDDGFETAQIRLAHELANLTDRQVTTKAVENIAGNPNSIISILAHLDNTGQPTSSIRVVSPYLFLARYYDSEGNVVKDGVTSAIEWAEQDPSHRVEIITNSVLTSDNIMAQSVIDMELGPRLLLSGELKKKWLSGLRKGELNTDLVNSAQWREQVSHSRIFLYQTGRLDAASLGKGSEEYGKLHAKFLLSDHYAFVGTHNFDYRSRLYNNEMGFFYVNPDVNRELGGIFDDLKGRSYRWGSPEWLELRKAVMDKGGMKGWGTRNQRWIYKFMKSTGLIWLI